LLIPNQFGSGNPYSTLCEGDAKRTAKRSARTCRWKPDQNKEKPPAGAIGQELKALYQVPQDLPQGMLTRLMQLNAPHEEE
jgi:hypothetical protein